MGVLGRLFAAARRAQARADAPRALNDHITQETAAMAAKKKSKKKPKSPPHPTGNTELCPVTGQEIPKRSELG